MDRWYGLANKNIKRIDELSNIPFDKYIEDDQAYIKSTRDIQYAFSQFNILGLKELNKMIMNYDIEIIKMRNLITLKENDIPPKEKISKLINDVARIQEPYYGKVKNFFENLK